MQKIQQIITEFALKFGKIRFFKINKFFGLKSISSLKQLVNTLPHCSGHQYVEIAGKMEIPLEDFEPFAFWNNETYTRNCIDRGEGYELILLCWEKGTDTPIHCHGGEECWVYGLKGEILEKRFDFSGDEQNIEVTKVERMKTDSISYMNDNMGFHKLINVGDGRAMTLHLYMNPIDRCRVYDEDKEEFKYAELAYHTFKGEPISEDIALSAK